MSVALALADGYGTPHSARDEACAPAPDVPGLLGTRRGAARKRLRELVRDDAAVRRWRHARAAELDAAHTSTHSPQGARAAMAPSAPVQDAPPRPVLVRRAWETAFAQLKSLLYACFTLWMSGSTLSLFSVTLLASVLYMNLQALRRTRAAFAPLEALDESLGRDRALAPQKAVYAGLSVAGVALALYKVHRLGLLPTAPADFARFAASQPRRQRGDGASTAAVTAAW